jgi:hypothetical protein
MASRDALQTVAEFALLPMTPRKKEIVDAYASDEIGNFTFYKIAREYVDSVKVEALHDHK